MSEKQNIIGICNTEGCYEDIDPGLSGTQWYGLCYDCYDKLRGESFIEDLNDIGGQ